MSALSGSLGANRGAAAVLGSWDGLLRMHTQGQGHVQNERQVLRQPQDAPCTSSQSRGIDINVASSSCSSQAGTHNGMLPQSLPPVAHSRPMAIPFSPGRPLRYSRLARSAADASPAAGTSGPALSSQGYVTVLGNSGGGGGGGTSGGGIACTPGRQGQQQRVSWDERVTFLDAAAPGSSGPAGGSGPDGEGLLRHSTSTDALGRAVSVSSSSPSSSQVQHAALLGAGPSSSGAWPPGGAHPQAGASWQQPPAMGPGEGASWQLPPATPLAHGMPRSRSYNSFRSTTDQGTPLRNSRSAILGTSPGALEAEWSMGVERDPPSASAGGWRGSLPRRGSFGGLPSSLMPGGAGAGRGGGGSPLTGSLGGGGSTLARVASLVGLPTCLICLDSLTAEDFESGEAMSLDCRCKGEVALRHRRCALKWSEVKGNTLCDVCKAPIANLPPVAPREAEAEEAALPTALWGDGREGWEDEPRGFADAVFDGIRVTWVTTIVCILFFELPVARSFLAGALVGSAYTALTGVLMARRARIAARTAASARAGGGLGDGDGAEQHWLLPGGARGERIPLLSEQV